jgi:PKD repeat protein
MDGIHAVRDNYGADMVSWFIENPQYCGIAYVNKGDLSVDAAWGFSVVKSGCATGYNSMAHELGHNMGSMHDRANSSNSGVYSYSYGHQDPSGDFRTVMAYNCPSGCTRQQFFSNPDLSFNNEPTGVDHLDVNSADNARSINQTRVPVSQWRTAVVGTPPVAGFSADCNLLDCNFTDTTTSDDSVVAWAWDFGDGADSTQENPSHLYSEAGAYTVSLTVEDDTGATGITTGVVVVDDGVVVLPPEVPSGVSATADAEAVTVIWSGDDNVDNYALERQNRHPKNGKWVGSTTVNFTGPIASYSELPGSGDFRYRLQASNQQGASDWSSWSNVVTVTSASCC